MLQIITETVLFPLTVPTFGDPKHVANFIFVPVGN